MKNSMTSHEGRMADGISPCAGREPVFKKNKMKKMLVAFGIFSIFFAGICFAQTSPSWAPTFTKATAPQECRYGSDAITDLGAWVNAPLKSNLSGGAPKKEMKCLATGKSTKSDGKKMAGACDTLDFNITVHGSKKDSSTQYVKGIAIEPKNGKYIVDPNAVECDKKGKCNLIDDYEDKNGRKIEIKCYKTNEFKNLVDSNEKSFCVIDKGLRIEEIDYPRADHFEWYCPYSWTESYPDGQDPYDPSNDYFVNLKNIYTHTPEKQELVYDCAMRMFALSQACAESLSTKVSTRKAIENIRSDFLEKKTEKIWRNELGFKESPTTSPKTDNARDYWNRVKGLSFRDICNQKSGGGCDPKEYENEENNDKKKGIEKIQAWLNDHPEFQKDSQTPAEYVKEEALKIWRDEENTKKNNVDNILGEEYPFPEEWKNKNPEDPAKEIYKTIINNAINAEDSARTISNYVKKRNMDLNVQVSIDQTKNINVSKYLRISDNSNEANLRAFSNDGKDDINIFDKIIRLTVQVLGTLAVLLLIISGVQMIISQGNENKLSEAKSVFTSTLIGLAIGFLSYTIVRFVIDTLLS